MDAAYRSREGLEEALKDSSGIVVLVSPAVLLD
jgi:hypothetical protein